MNYADTLDFLFKRLPMFQRDGAAAYKADLSTTIDLSLILGNPQNDFPAIHIAGTNGKGSVSHLIASVLMEAGYKTALFTSPHLRDFRERIKVNGQMVSEEFVIDFIQNLISSDGTFCNGLNPSFFELTYGMAMSYFSEQKVDIAVIEVGMGGRLDSTNIVNSIITAITNIGMDHTAFLGDTIEKIAIEKAGIIKNKIPLIIGREQADTKDVFSKMAKEKSATIYYSKDIGKFTSKDFVSSGNMSVSIGYDKSIDISSPLRGQYQIENLSTVISLYKVLNQYSNFEKLIDFKYLKNGIENVIQNTGFKGRWQFLSTNPQIICDTGHNIDGIISTMKQLEMIRYKKLHMVIGMVNDKDIKSILNLMPKKATYYFCRPDIPRGFNADELSQIANEMGLIGNAFNSVNEALNQAKLEANSEDLIFVGGSTFVVAEVV